MTENNEEGKTEENVKKESSINTEKLKNETSNTVNQVKDTIKNVNIKQDSIETKNFVVEMFTKPLEKIKEVVDDTSGKTFKYALIIIAIWAAVGLLSSIFNGAFNLPGGEAIWMIIKSIITPILEILVMAVIILMFSNENKKSLTTIISAITIANVPVVISSIIKMLNYLGNQVYRITSPISTFCSLITTVLTYFAIKYIFDKEDNEAIKSFAIVKIIYIVVAFALSFMGLYI